jgi:hypothetical protein
MSGDNVKKKVMAALAARKSSAHATPNHTTAIPVEEWNDRARNALSLGDSDVSLKAAFDSGGLDADNPQHWRDLLEIFSGAIFAQKKRPGRRREWQDLRPVLEQRLRELQAKYPDFKPARLVAILAKSPEFSGRSASTLRRKLYADSRSAQWHSDLFLNRCSSTLLLNRTSSSTTIIDELVEMLLLSWFLRENHMPDIRSEK